MVLAGKAADDWVEEDTDTAGRTAEDRDTHNQAAGTDLQKEAKSMKSNH